MGDIAAYMKNEKVSINDIKLIPRELAELIASIKGGTISGKIGKEVMFPLPMLLLIQTSSGSFLFFSFSEATGCITQ
jgi:hypothetical protein